MGRKYLPLDRLILYQQSLINSKLYKTEFRENYNSDSMEILEEYPNTEIEPKWITENNLIPLFHWKLNNFNDESPSNYFSDSGKYGIRLYKENPLVLNEDEYIYTSLDIDTGEKLEGSFLIESFYLNSFTYTCWMKVSEYSDSILFFKIWNGTDTINIYFDPHDLTNGTVQNQVITTTNTISLPINNNQRHFDGELTNYIFVSFSYHPLYRSSDTCYYICHVTVMQNKHGRFTTDGKQIISQFYYLDTLEKSSGIIDINRSSIEIGGLSNNLYKMEDIRFYDRYLTINEMSAIYNDGMGTYQQTNNSYPTIRHPIHWFKLQELYYPENTDCINDSGYKSRMLHIFDRIIDVTCNINVEDINVEDWVTCTNINNGFLYNDNMDYFVGLYKYSISFWFKIDFEATSEQYVYFVRNYIDNNGLLVFYDKNSDRIKFMVNNVDVSTTTVIVENTWYHVCCTYDYKNPINNGVQTAIIYLNGKKEGTSNDLGIVTDNGIKIGGTENENGANNYMFDVRIFDYPLTGNETEQLYNNRNPILF